MCETSLLGFHKLLKALDISISQAIISWEVPTLFSIMTLDLADKLWVVSRLTDIHDEDDHDITHLC